MHATETTVKNKPSERAARPTTTMNAAALRQAPLWSQRMLPLQTSLKINAPGDKYEQEADNMADQVMRMAAPQLQRKHCSCGNSIAPDGMCDECKQKKLSIQRMASGDTPQTIAPPVVHQVLQQPGRPLDSPSRNYMESRFGQDFGQVRVHTDGQAAESAKALQARAYTIGRDIIFGANEFQPQTTAGKDLLAHELTHHLQQQSNHGEQTAMRVEVEDCDEAAGHSPDDLLVVHFHAQRLLQKALEMTEERDARGDRLPAVKAALLKWFKIDLDDGMPFENAQKLTHVITALQTTLDGSGDTVYECGEYGVVEVCKPGRNAVTLGNIHICPDRWLELADRQPIILIHEWGHKYGQGINRLMETYCWEENFADLPSSERIEMPDAYEGYISELSLGKGTC